MKKFICAIIAVVASVATVSAAQVIKKYILQVNTTDGQTVEYAFSGIPTATFNGDKMSIKALASPAVEYAMDNVASLTLTDDKSGVAELTTDGRAVRFTVTDSEIVIDGMEASGRVAVYGTNGQLAASASADASGHAVVAIDALGKGVYVVATPPQSFKFIK